jgi:hypothetical protein
MIVVGLQQVRVLMQNPPVELELPRANRVRDKSTQRVAGRWSIWGSIE